MTDLHLEIKSDIYNPWSIINFLRLKSLKTHYWADSSSNGLINSLVQKGSLIYKNNGRKSYQG